MSEIESLRCEVDALKHVVAGLLDAMKWHLRGAEGTDQSSLDKAQRTFERAFLNDDQPRT